MKREFLTLLVALVSTFALMGQTETGYITVVGQSEVKMVPEEVIVSIPISSNDMDFAKCYAQLVKQTDEIKSALKKAGVDSKMITLENLNVNKDYNYENGKRQYKGFKGSVSMQVKQTFDNKSLNSILNILNEHENVYSIGFVLSEAQNKSLREQAIDAAVRDALANARQLAKSANVGLGEIVTINYGAAESFPEMPYIRENAMAYSVAKSSGSDSIELTPEAQIISKRVTMKFRLLTNL